MDIHNVKPLSTSTFENYPFSKQLL